MRCVIYRRVSTEDQVKEWFFPRVVVSFNKTIEHIGSTSVEGLGAKPLSLDASHPKTRRTTNHDAKSF